MRTSYHYFKNILLFLALTGLSIALNAQNAWINEIHYDNTGTDAGEFIEVVIESASSYNLADFSVILYNGSDSKLYNTKTLDLFIAGATTGNFSLFHFVYPANGIQNGAPDGMALVYMGSVISGQFLSYEGTLTAIDGAATGLTSVNIGVLEVGTEPLGLSLQLSGSGGVYSSFTWQAPATATAGALNNGQTISAEAVDNPSAFSAIPASPYQIDLSWILNIEVDSVMIAYYHTPAFGTPTGVYPVGAPISGGGIVLYKGIGTSTIHSGLFVDSTYYYKAWSYTSAHVYSSGVAASAATLKLEPSNYPTGFMAAATGITVTLDWTDASGGQLPDAYLIKLSDQDNITAPSDSSPVPDDRDVADGIGAINVAYGQESFTFYRLEETTVYYFKIYPYTNSGGGINFKTNDSAPADNDETQSILNVNDFEGNNFGTWTTYSVATIRNWTVFTGTGAYSTTHYANINGYQTPSDTLENDWLISPSLNLNSYTAEKLIFFSWWNFSIETNELKLKYSTNYVSGDPMLATWTELTFVKPTVALTWAPSGFIDLSSISGTNVHIAFQYLSTASPRSWSVDEIEITGTGVSNPSNFNATTVSSTQIDLTWNKNNNNNNVLLAWNTSNTFGTPAGSYPDGAGIIGGGTVLYTGQNEFYQHTGRNPATAYYYKAWSVNESIIYSPGVTDNASTQFLEPSNHPTGLTAVSNGATQITVSWTDSDAAHYLVKGSNISYSSIVPPVDGVGQGDSLLVKNVNASVQSQVFTGLNVDSIYYFKIYPFNGTGESSNYKTNGTIPQTSARTDELNLDIIISEVSDPLDSAKAKFVEVFNAGNITIDFTSTPVYLCRQSNGGSWNSVQLTGTLTAGDNIILAYVFSTSAADTARFFNTYGFLADKYSNFISGNGNDGYFLYYGGNQSSGTLLDAYGVINEDGTGKAWEYTDKKAVRKSNISTPNATWTPSEWVILADTAFAMDMTPGYHKGTITWQGTTSTNWNVKGNNWNSPNGYIPDASCIVTIPNVTNFPIITEPSACDELLIQINSSLSIQSTGSLLIVGP